MKKDILKIMLGSIILEVVLVCFFILIGSFDDIAWKAMGSAGIIFIFTIPCLSYSKIYDDERYKYIGISGAAFVCYVALLNLLILWDLVDYTEVLVKINTTFNVIIWMHAFISKFYNIHLPIIY